MLSLFVVDKTKHKRNYYYCNSSHTYNIYSETIDNIGFMIKIPEIIDFTRVLNVN